MSEREARSREGALAQSSALATAGLVAGVLGATALVFAVILYAIDPGVVGLTILNAAFAVVALVFYATSNWGSLGRAFAGRSTAFVVMEVAVVGGIVALAATANWFASQSAIEWDLTRDRLFSLADQSVKVASGLDEPVKVIGFFKSTDPQRNKLVDLVELYRRHTELLTVEILSPDSTPPAVLEKWRMTATSPRIVVATEAGRSAKIRSPSEDLLTSALIKVADRPARKVYLLQGHGEARADDEKGELGYAEAAADLRNEGYEVETLSLATADSVPKDSAVIVVAGASTPLLPNEAGALASWLERGGRLFLLLEPAVDAGLGTILASFGIVLRDDLVVDPSSATRAFGFGPDTTVVQRFEPHPITDPLAGSAALFRGARSVSPLLGGAGKAKVSTLVVTGKESWAEGSYRAPGEPERGEEDLVGPVPIAVAATKDTITLEDRASDQARLVVFGDASFAANRFGSMSGNGDLFTNAVNWLAGDEQKLSIRPKARGASSILITEDQQYGIMFFAVNFLPLVIVGVGYSVWAVRRRK